MLFMAFGLSDRVRGISPSPTLSIDTKTKELMQRGVDVINLSVGEPDFPTPAQASLAGIQAIAEGFTKYTAVAGIHELRSAIARKLQEENGLEYDPEEILVSVGAKHSLYNAFMALCNPGDEVILPAPYWVSYPEQIKLAGAKPVILPTDESTSFKITPQQLEQAITPRTKALLLNSPSNPTGAVYTKEELAALAEVIIRHEFYVISDEIYEKLVYGVEHVSIAALHPEIKKRTLVVNGFSKTFSMTGWRVGYLAADRTLVKAMAGLQGHSTSNPASMAQRAALTALSCFDPAMVEEFRKRRDYVVDRLRRMAPIECVEPPGAFYVFPNVAGFFGRRYRGTPIENVDHLCTLLLEEAKIAIVPGTGFGAPNNMRISYAVSIDTLQQAMDRLEAFARETV
jgi:aspartate aminotransferase